MVTMALRTFSLAFLAWHFARLVPGLADPWFVALAAAVGLWGGAAVRTLRLPLALPAGLLVFGTVALLLTGLPSLLAGSAPSFLDTVPLWADRQLMVAALPFAVGWFEGWTFTALPGRRAWERLIHAAVAVAVFWSQGPYHVTLYPNPLTLALVFGLFVSSELALLVGRVPRVLPKFAALLVVFGGFALLWGLLGRYEDQSIASGGGLMKPDLFQFDFAPLVRLEDEITLGDNLVLLYREEGTPRTRYLRRMVLEAYDPAQGFSLLGGTPPSVGRRPQTLPAASGLEERQLVHQEYYLVNLDPSSFLGLNEPVGLTPYAQWNRSSFVNAYRVDSLVPGDQFWLYNDVQDDGLSPVERTRDTAGGNDPEIRALALSMTKGAHTPYEKATAILLSLKENYFYSLKPGRAGPRGALKHFLFEGKKGYCSYFAFSMALLLRSLDIPARIAVGFATNPRDSVLGFTPVRAFQAHAWVEIPFGPYGWLEFDPTSETPAPGEAFQTPKSTDPETLSRLISEILEAQPQPLADQPVTAQEAAPLGWEQVWRKGLSSGPLLLAVLLLAFNEAWRYRWAWRRFRAGTDNRRVAVRWSQLVEKARRARCGPLPGETPEAWSARQGQQQDLWASLAHNVSQARYAPLVAGQIEALVAVQAKALGRTLDESRPWYHRLASSVLPWWPA